MFAAFEELSIQNEAYRKAFDNLVTHGPEALAKSLQDHRDNFLSAERTLHGIQKYTDLHSRIEAALATRNVDELTLLAKTVSERVAAWGGIAR
jgi:hypothetical protein